MQRRHMSTYQHTAFAALDRYDIFHGGRQSDAGVSSGQCRRLWSLKELGEFRLR